MKGHYATDNLLELMAVLRVMEMHGIEEAARLYPDYIEFIERNKHTDLEVLKEEILNDQHFHPHGH